MLTWSQTDEPWRTPTIDDGRLQAEVRELMCYLWDNYLQLYDAEEVFFVGVGYAHIGVKMLLLNRNDASPPGRFHVQNKNFGTLTMIY